MKTLKRWNRELLEADRIDLSFMMVKRAVDDPYDLARTQRTGTQARRYVTHASVCRAHSASARTRPQAVPAAARRRSCKAQYRKQSRNWPVSTSRTCIRTAVSCASTLHLDRRSRAAVVTPDGLEGGCGGGRGSGPHCGPLMLDTPADAKTMKKGGCIAVRRWCVFSALLDVC